MPAVGSEKRGHRTTKHINNFFRGWILWQFCLCAPQETAPNSTSTAFGPPLSPGAIHIFMFSGLFSPRRSGERSLRTRWSKTIRESRHELHLQLSFLLLRAFILMARSADRSQVLLARLSETTNTLYECMTCTPTQAQSCTLVHVTQQQKLRSTRLQVSLPFWTQVSHASEANVTLAMLALVLELGTNTSHPLRCVLTLAGLAMTT